jgi:hypothetical protein
MSVLSGRLQFRISGESLLCDDVRSRGFESFDDLVFSPNTLFLRPTFLKSKWSFTSRPLPPGQEAVAFPRRRVGPREKLASSRWPLTPPSSHRGQQQLGLEFVNIAESNKEQLKAKAVADAKVPKAKAGSS